MRASIVKKIDLDALKAVNDEHGHLDGSQLLVEVAHIVRACVREDDVAARYGGDVYLVILRDSGREAAARIAERIREAIATHTFLARQGKQLRVTASIGVATYPGDAPDQESLIEAADQAMYRGKRAGRNIVIVHGDERQLDVSSSQRA
ncbi:MAG: GGDEF domain-containing protein [Myxococcota bacterium]